MAAQNLGPSRTRILNDNSNRNKQYMKKVLFIISSIAFVACGSPETMGTMEELAENHA